MYKEGWEGEVMHHRQKRVYLLSFRKVFVVVFFAHHFSFVAAHLFCRTSALAVYYCKKGPQSSAPLQLPQSNSELSKNSSEKD